MRFARLITAALFLVGLLGITAQPTTAQMQNVETFTLQPGGQAMVMFEAYCLDFGRAFPDNVQRPAGMAPDPIRGALMYARSQNLTDTKEEALSLQHAIWRLSNVQGSPQGDTLTEQIVNNAQSTNVTPMAGAMSLLDAVSANQVSVTVNSWQPLGEEIQIGNVMDHYRGTGQLTVSNTSQQPLTLYMPVGAIFPSSDQAVQNMTGFATSVQVQNPATPTPQPTNTPQPQPPLQLPDTGADTGSLAWLLGLAAVGVVGVGWFAVRQAKRS